MIGSLYAVWVIAGVLCTGWIWARAAREDSRLPFIYFAALLGALVGAKVVYLLAEGWIDWNRPDRWLRLATGKTILGGFLFGYPAVEWTKARLGYTSPTGDRFALVAPLGVALGRLGCWTHGCCLGVACEPAWYTVRDATGLPRWPAVPLEFAFNLAAFLAVLLVPPRDSLRGQRFHLYLIAYGLFRFAHEFVRDTPRVIGPLSGYALAALAVAGLGAVGFLKRARTIQPQPSR